MDEQQQNQPLTDNQIFIKNNNHNVQTILISLLCCAIICVTSMFFYHQFNPKIIVNQTILTYDSTLSSKSLTDVISDIQPCVVEVRAQLSNGTSAGSGVVYSKKSNSNVYLIITNYHVVENAINIYVTLCDGNTNIVAKFIGADVVNDIAMLQVTTTADSTLIKPATLGDSSTLKVGEVAIVIGNPLGQLGGTVTTGIISALDRQILVDGVEMTLLQTNAQINKGNSGGGIFNELGHLVGVVNAKSNATGVEGIGFAIPINVAKNSANEICSTYTPSTKGYITNQVVFAQSYYEVNAQNYADYMFSTYFRDYGVYIASLYTGSDFYNAGLKTYDYIYSIDGNSYLTIREINAYLKTKNIGDTVNIVIKRFVGNSYQLGQVDITLTQFICQG